MIASTTTDFTAPRAGATVAPMKTLTIPQPPARVLALLRIARWPASGATVEERRRRLVDIARARNDGTWETLWCWAWAALGELAVEGVTAPGGFEHDDPKVTTQAMLDRTSKAVAGLGVSSRPAAAWVAALLGYAEEGVRQRMSSLEWPGRRSGAGEVRVTFAAPTTTSEATEALEETPTKEPAASTASATPADPDAPKPPAKVLRVLGVTAWPTEKAARATLTATLRATDHDAWVQLIRWAFDGGELSSPEAMERIGNHPKHGPRIIASDPALADLKRKPGRRPGVPLKSRTTDATPPAATTPDPSKN